MCAPWSDINRTRRPPAPEGRLWHPRGDCSLTTGRGDQAHKVVEARGRKGEREGLAVPAAGGRLAVGALPRGPGQGSRVHPVPPSRAASWQFRSITLATDHPPTCLSGQVTFLRGRRGLWGRPAGRSRVTVRRCRPWGRIPL